MFVAIGVTYSSDGTRQFHNTLVLYFTSNNLYKTCIKSLKAGTIAGTAILGGAANATKHAAAHALRTRIIEI